MRLAIQGTYTKFLFAFICISILWLYATLTGMSPSVIRAVVMFSVIAISELVSREANIYNSLAIAAFILLLFDPNLLYAVGFQLSFIAVLGIVYLQPKIYKMVVCKHWLLDQIWGLTSVSIAAQLATFPLSVYYFHQFPTYFLVFNLIVLPAAFLMLLLGILTLLIEPIFPTLSILSGKGLYLTIWSVNETLLTLQKFLNSTIKGLYLDSTSVFLLYGIAICLFAGIQFRSFKTLILSVLLILLLFSLKSYEHFKQIQKQQLVFYNIPNRILVDYIHGHQVETFSDKPILKSNEKSLAFHVDPYRLASRLNSLEQSEVQIINNDSKNPVSPYMIAGKRLLIVDTTTFHVTFTKPIQADIILINQEAIKNIKWFTNHFEANYLLFGIGNSARYLRKMKEESKKMGLKIHSLNQDGALIIDIK